MKRLRLIAMFLAATALGALPGRAQEPPPESGQPQRVSKHVPLSFASGRSITVDVVDTPAARERGLMFRRSLPKDYGMLFVFPVQAVMTFWMKNTWASLDIVFIDRDKKVTVVHERVPASDEKTTDERVARVRGLAHYVLELPAGTARRRGLKAGQRLQFKVSVPER